MAPRQPRDTVLTGPEREELLATLRETRQKLVHAGERLKRGCVLRRSLDTVIENIDDVGFAITSHDSSQAEGRVNNGARGFLYQ